MRSRGLGRAAGNRCRCRIAWAFPVASAVTEQYVFRPDADLQSCFYGDAVFRDFCCRAEDAAPECWKAPFFSFERCCRAELELHIADDAECFDAGRRAEDRLPHDRPSAAEPLVFLWDAKTGGNTLKTMLFESLAEWRLVPRSQLSGSIQPNLAGVPFLVKQYPAHFRRQMVAVAGHFDWRVMSALGCGAEKQPRCILLLRHPVERLVSWLLDEFQAVMVKETGTSVPSTFYTIEPPMDQWTPERLREVLEPLRRENMEYSGREEGVFCSNNMCLNASRTSAAGVPAKVVGDNAVPHNFRRLGGPQNRLLRMLDPEGERLNVAKRRMELCIIGRMVDDYQSTIAMVGAAFPWLKEVLVLGETPLHDPGWSKKVAEFDDLKQRTYRAAMGGHLQPLLAAFSAADMELYEHGLRLHHRQRHALAGGKPRLPPIRVPGRSLGAGSSSKFFDGISEVTFGPMSWATLLNASG